MHRRLLVLGWFATIGLAQSSPAQEEFLTRGRVPHFTGKYRLALGERIEKAGKERVSIVGSLTALGKTVPATIRWEVPGKFRLDQQGGGRPLLANGPGLGLGASQASLDAAEDALVESLLLDRSESALFGIASGNAVRLVGEQVREGRNPGPQYAGPYYDVLDVVAKGDGRPTSPRRQKRYFFDSSTGLLRRVIYRVPTIAGGTDLVETMFDQWTTIEGNAFPLVTERRVNGVVVVRFQATSHVLGRKVPDATFTTP